MMADFHCLGSFPVFHDKLQMYNSLSLPKIPRLDKKCPGILSGPDTVDLRLTCILKDGLISKSDTDTAAAFVLAALAVTAFASLHEPIHHHAPQPYKFGYSIKDHHGEQHREESGDGGHAVRGSYGFTDARGIRRQVHYVADHGGFRAEVKTNEPGTANQNPAAVHLISDAPYAHGGYAGAAGLGYGGLGYAGYGGLGNAGYGGLGYAGYGGYGLGYGGNGLGILGGLGYARYGF
ncbi:cuticle protein 16.8 [Trichonephila inaurata madagascariensis]|uniref:Cuticle protein 16.8 n=1 Tax=Trichonephila inaurata madagascariensis TaxID=2747483 RepID=A0A8X6YMW8_9ARAC|nr:cuticle protein 16.8 [Trichonephila inaurata madagascariensis]